MGFEKVPLRLVLALPRGATWMDEGVVVHVQGGKEFFCKIFYTIKKLIMMSCDESTLLVVQHVTWSECVIMYFIDIGTYEEEYE